MSVRRGEYHAIDIEKPLTEMVSMNDEEKVSSDEGDDTGSLEEKETKIQDTRDDKFTNEIIEELI